MNTTYKVGDKVRNRFDRNFIGTIEMLTNHGCSAYIRAKGFKIYVELSCYEKIEEEPNE